MGEGRDGLPRGRFPRASAIQEFGSMEFEGSPA